MDCGAAREQQQNGFSSSIKLNPSSFVNHGGSLTWLHQHLHSYHNKTKCTSKCARTLPVPVLVGY